MKKIIFIVSLLFLNIKMTETITRISNNHFFVKNTVEFLDPIVYSGGWDVIGIYNHMYQDIHQI